MDRALRIMAEDKPQPIAQRSPNLGDDRNGVQTIGAFVIAVFDDRDRRVVRAEGMILGGDGID